MSNDIEIFEPPIRRGHDRWLELGEITGMPCGSFARDRREVYLCTRGQGHEGDHAAHGLSNEQYRRWAQS